MRQKKPLKKNFYCKKGLIRENARIFCTYNIRSNIGNVFFISPILFLGKCRIHHGTYIFLYGFPYIWWQLRNRYSYRCRAFVWVPFDISTIIIPKAWKRKRPFLRYREIQNINCSLILQGGGGTRNRLNTVRNTVYFIKLTLDLYSTTGIEKIVKSVNQSL